MRNLLLLWNAGIFAAIVVVHALPNGQVGRDLPVTDDLFDSEPEDLFASNPDAQLFSSSDESAPQDFDLAQAVPCDESSTNIDMFLNARELNARELTDESPGLSGLDTLVAGASCQSPTSAESSDLDGTKLEINLVPGPVVKANSATFTTPGVCGGSQGTYYFWALQCDGQEVGGDVRGCLPYGTPRITMGPIKDYCCHEYLPADQLGRSCIGGSWRQFRPPTFVGDYWGGSVRVDPWSGTPGFRGD